MHPTTLIYLFVSAVSAVRHYGLLPSGDTNSLMEQQFQDLLGDDLRLVSRFTTDEHQTHDGSDFLAAELGIFNKTVSDIFATSGQPSNAINDRGFDTSGLEIRNPVNAQCVGHGNIEDNLSHDQVNQVCIAMTLGVSTGVWRIIGVVESKLCVEAGTGHPIESCKTVMGMTQFAGATLTVLEIDKYCPQFLSFFVKCRGSDAKAEQEKNAGIEMTAFNSQKDYSCKNSNEEGTECVDETVG